MKTTLLLASGLLAAMCAPTYADSVALPKNGTEAPSFNQIPRDYNEFVEVYNKTLAFMRANDIRSQRKCYPPGADPSYSHGWCQDVLRWANRNRQHIALVENQTDDGTVNNELCFGDEPDKQRCFFSTGRVVDQTANKKANLFLTDREVAGVWEARDRPPSELSVPGKALEDLKPHDP